jgi:hypothetical protein
MSVLTRNPDWLINKEFVVIFSLIAAALAGLLHWAAQAALGKLQE